MIKHNKKKILVGICGIGHGHSVRQKVILDYLLKNNHTIVTFITDAGSNFLNKNFPNIPSINVSVPWIHCDKNGIDLLKTGQNKINQSNSFVSNNFLAMDKALTMLGGEPDIILTDYEPTCAQFAYILDKPLICLEQQSKFLGYKTQDIGNFTRNEEVARLKLFFPTASKRYSSSFFPITDKIDEKYQVDLTPPLLADDIMKAKELNILPKENNILVYLSPYGLFRQSLKDIIAILCSISEYNFNLFCCDADSVNIGKYKNVHIFNFDRQLFLKKLLDCNAIISTAGHQLLSEAVLLNKPVLVLPFDTYEQQYNAWIWEGYGLGNRAELLTVELIRKYISNLEKFRSNITSFKVNTGFCNGTDILTSSLHSNFGL